MATSWMENMLLPSNSTKEKSPEFEEAKSSKIENYNFEHKTNCCKYITVHFLLLYLKNKMSNRLFNQKMFDNVITCVEKPQH